MRFLSQRAWPEAYPSSEVDEGRGIVDDRLDVQHTQTHTDRESVNTYREGNGRTLNGS
jgi:hypothetical protein